MERPVLFNTDMVKAIIALIKKNTRRPIKIEFLPGYNPEWTGYKPVFEYGRFYLANSKGEPATKEVKSPCKVGDILWVRETFADLRGMGFDKPFAYFVDCLGKNGLEDADGKRCRLDYGVKWKPSIHMPRAAARIFLKVTDVRVERLWDISEKDAAREGCGPSLHSKTSTSAKQDFMHLWQQIYDSDINKCWALNSWVWVIEFEGMV